MTIVTPGPSITVPPLLVRLRRFLLKTFPLKGEKRVIVFRAEMYNIFNHTQFSGYNIGPSYGWNNRKNGTLV